VWGNPTEGHFGPANAGVESSLWYKGVSSPGNCWHHKSTIQGTPGS